MKIRNGFVSNSSTSSFIIMFKGTAKQLEKKLQQVFNIPLPENYPIKIGGLNKVSERFIYNLNETSFKSVKAYKKEFYIEDENDIDKWHKKALTKIKDGWTIYTGGFADDGGEDIDPILCNSDIEYEDEEIVIFQEGGY